MQKSILCWRGFMITLITIIVIIASKWTANGSGFKYFVEKEKTQTEIPFERSVYKNRTKEFVYSSELLLEGIIALNERNCMMRYGNASLCTLLSQRENSTLVSRPPEGFVKRLPKALIIGVYKGGTREFIEFIAMHPMVKIQRLPHYEISYFSNTQLLRKGLKWYRQRMPVSFTGQLTIEKSPDYFASAVAPKEIYKMDPDIKLILLVREPASRTLSHFSFNHRNKNISGYSELENCVLKRTNTKSKVNERCYYLKHSMYSTNLKRYLKYFTMEQIHIIDSVEFAKDPCLVLKRAEKFLQLEPLISCNDFVYNKAKSFFCIADPSNEQRGLCYDKTRGRANATAMGKTRKGLELVLKDFFVPYNKEFFRMVNRTFNW